MSQEVDDHLKEFSSNRVLNLELMESAKEMIEKHKQDYLIKVYGAEDVPQLPPYLQPEEKVVEPNPPTLSIKKIGAVFFILYLLVTMIGAIDLLS